MKISQSDRPRMFASLRLTGPSLVPASVNGFFGLNPTLAYCRGEEYFDNRTGEKHLRKTGLWLLSTEEFKNLYTMQEHLNVIEEIVYNNKFCCCPDTELLSLSKFLTLNTFGLTISLFWHGPAYSTAPEFDQAFADRVKAIGGAFETDFDTDSESCAA